MGIVEGPAMSLRASGNVGPLCYSRWRGLQIARAKSTLVCPMTTPQEKAQDAVRTASQGWSGTLTAGERQMWHDFAGSKVLVNALGLEWKPGGYVMYMKMSVNALLFGGVIQTVPPVVSRDVMVTSMTAEPTVNPGEVDCEMTIASGGETPDLLQIFRAGPFDGGGRHAIAPEYLEVQQVATPFQWTDTGLDSAKYYWYRMRWGCLDGHAGNYWFRQVLTV